MGLDISVAQNLIFLNESIPEKWTVHIYEGPRSDGVKEGYYKADEVFSFRAGAYSSYNRFRAELCQIVHGVEPEVIWENRLRWRAKPFYELIDFSDCEGVIGPVTSAKLHEDFKNHQNNIKNYRNKAQNPPLVDFMVNYNNWMKAFQLAAGDGVVCFH